MSFSGHMRCCFAEERRLTSEALVTPRIFKLTDGGQWQQPSLEGKYIPLSSTRLLKRLQMGISKPAGRKTAE